MDLLVCKNVTNLFVGEVIDGQLYAFALIIFQGCKISSERQMKNENIETLTLPM